MQMMTVEQVDFYGDTLFAQKQEDGPPMIAVKPMVERMGLDWSAQLQRIKRDEVLSEGMAMITIPSPGGPQESVALPLNLIPGFLFGISVGSIPDPEVKKRALAYKRHCHDVLYRHFFGPAELAEPTDAWDWEAIGAKVQLVRETRLSKGKKAAAALWDVLGLPTAELPHDVPKSGALQGIDFVRQFLGACTTEAPGGRVQASELKRKYDQWALDEKAPYMTARAFAMCLDAIGIAKAKAHNHYYLGIRILHLSEIAH